MNEAFNPTLTDELAWLNAGKNEAAKKAAAPHDSEQYAIDNRMQNRSNHFSLYWGSTKSVSSSSFMLCRRRWQVLNLSRSCMDQGRSIKPDEALQNSYNKFQFLQLTKNAQQSD